MYARLCIPINTRPILPTHCRRWTTATHVCMLLKLLASATDAASASASQRTRWRPVWLTTCRETIGSLGLPSNYTRYQDSTWLFIVLMQHSSLTISTIKRYNRSSANYLTSSPPILLRFYTLSYWSNPPVLIFDISALWHSGLSARATECQKSELLGYSMQYSPERFKQ